MRADVMLAWMSEVGSGDLQDLRQRITWLARTANLNPSKTEPGRWLRDISALGHAELDWDRGRWAIAPSAAALLPASDGTTVLTGRRPLDLVARLDRDLAVQVAEAEAKESARLRAPSIVYLQTDSLADLRHALAEAGVHYVGCAARHLADNLPNLQLAAAAGQPAWGTPTEHLVVGGASGIAFARGLPDGDGLCRFTVQNRLQYRYRVGNDWFRTAHAPGIWWALAEQHERVIRWRRDRRAGDEEIGTLFVDQGAPLPPLQARALVLCSGLPTQFGQTARTAIYRNVPRSVADLVARSVRQHVSVID